MSKPKIDTVKKHDDGTWGFLHPETKQLTGSYRLRVVARAARAAAVKGIPFGEPAADDTTTRDDSGTLGDEGAPFPFAEAADDVEEPGVLGAGVVSMDMAPIEQRVFEEVVDKTVVDPVKSPVDNATSADATSTGETGDVAPQQKEKTIMIVKFVKSTKDRKSAQIVYQAEGNPRFSLRFAKTGFVDASNTPAFINIESDAFAEVKPKLTAEQRKQARKDAPKLSPAQKLAKLQERAAKLQAKIDAEAAAKAAAASTPATPAA